MLYFVTKKAQYKKYCVAVKGPKWPWFLFEVAVDAWRDLATRHPKAPQATPHVYTHSASQLTNVQQLNIQYTVRMAMQQIQ